MCRVSYRAPRWQWAGNRALARPKKPRKVEPADARIFTRMLPGPTNPKILLLSKSTSTRFEILLQIICDTSNIRARSRSPQIATATATGPERAGRVPKTATPLANRAVRASPPPRASRPNLLNCPSPASIHIRAHLKLNPSTT